MINLIRAKWLVLALGLLPLAIGIISEFVKQPEWLNNYPGLPWVILVVLIAAFLVLTYLEVRESNSGDQSDESSSDQRVGSPYIVGPPIQEPEYFFGRRAEVNRFFAYLNAPQPQPLQVLGIRRTGKTSFLRYVSHPDVVREKVREPANTLVIYIDLQADIKTVADFYLALGEGINRSLPRNSLPLPAEGFPTRRAFIKWLESPQLASYRLIILLDEFEALREEAGFDSSFFKGLRALVSRRLAWVTISYRDLYRLSRILGESEKTSPFFNIFHPTPLILGGLSESEAERLIQNPATAYGVHFAPQEIISIQQLAGGLPFLLQLAAEAWFNAKQQNRQRSQIKSEVKRKLATAMVRHFDWYWRHFDEDERVLLSRLAMETPTDWSAYRQQHGDTALNDLLHYGLITQEGENYGIASEVFAEWIHRRANMPSPPDDQST